MAHDADIHAGRFTAASPLSELWRLIASQTAMLFAGFATAQGCSFLRNAIMAHVLSRGDFGIAATILLTLQLIETLTDVGSDKLIIQADDGASRTVVGTAQTFQMARGVATAFILIATAYPLAAFYRVPEAATAFMAVGLAPLLKGFLNLDMRRAQRALNNRPYMAVEVVPQIFALLATPFALLISPTYDAVIIVAVVQAGAMLIVSHLMASERIAPSWNRNVAIRMFTFSWPIWVSAIPLIAVYQGDRILIGRYIGMEAVAGYSAAFLITMVPGLIVAKIGHAILLPLLADCKHDRATFLGRLRVMLSFAMPVAAVYAIGFALLGGPILTVAFGSAYAGLDLVVTLLALMWAMRMIQAVPGMALIAQGRTRTLLAAGILRALGLIPAWIVITQGGGIAMVALVAVAAELVSLGYMLTSVSRR